MTQLKLWLAIASSLVSATLCITPLCAMESAKAPPVPSTPLGAELVPNPAINSVNLILNGDFEISTVVPGCYYNLSNSEVTAALPNIFAYGTAQEIDLMSKTSCPFTIAPQSGTSRLAIHRQAAEFGGGSDEFAFALSEPVVAGAPYTIAFYAWANLATDPDIGAVEVGLSSSAAAFGTKVFSGTATTSGWTLLTGSFVAPLEASYLTVRVSENVEAWNHLDNFTLVHDGPTPVQLSSWGSLKSTYR